MMIARDISCIYPEGVWLDIEATKSMIINTMPHCKINSCTIHLRRDTDRRIALLCVFYYNRLDVWILP